MAFQKNFFSGQDPDALLQDPRIRQMMQALQQLDPALLQRAAALAAAGKPEQARQLLAAETETEVRDG